MFEIGGSESRTDRRKLACARVANEVGSQRHGGTHDCRQQVAEISDQPELRRQHLLGKAATSGGSLMHDATDRIAPRASYATQWISALDLVVVTPNDGRHQQVADGD